MKNLLITAIITAASGVFAIAQTQQAPSFILNQHLTGNQHYKASQFIEMGLAPGSTTGFEYNAQYSGGEFIAEIDPFMVFPPVEGEFGGPNTGDQGVVGSIAGVFDVNEMGAATYSIPIKLPAGIGGNIPLISFNYSSMAGNGIMGIGWNLGAVSAISRSGKSIYHDGLVQGLQYNAFDNLSFNGMRMMPLAANEYTTEVEGFTKITVLESNEYGPIKFEARTKDGKKLLFGESENSRQKLGNTDIIIGWFLSSVIDLSGNETEYMYEARSGNLLLKELNYGGNNSNNQSHIYKVVFNYTSGRVDTFTSYLNGAAFTTDCLLDNVQIKYLPQNLLLFTYDLIYDESLTLYSRLDKVKIIENVENIEINPTKIEWGAMTENFTFSPTNITKKAGYSRDLTLGDFNGDGKTDILAAYYYYDNGIKKYDSWSIFYLNALGTGYNEVVMGELDELHQPSFSYFLAGDFNGDGYDDLIKVTSHGPNIYGAYLYVSDGVSDFSFGGSIPTQFDGNHNIRITDINGNGYNEVLLITTQFDGANNRRNIVIKSFEKNVTSNSFKSLFVNHPNSDGYSYSVNFGTELFPLQTGDFNGDGRTDLLVNTNVLESTILSLHTTDPILVELTPNRFGFPNSYHRVFAGDFNGDGISDILTYAYANLQYGWQLHYFNGKDAWIEGYCPVTLNIDPENLQNPNRFIYTTDINGDGKSDILDIYYQYSGNQIIGTHFDMYYSKGNGFKNLETAFFPQLVPHKSHIHNFFDFNGDGKAESLIWVSPDSPLHIMAYHREEKSNLVLSFVNGHGTKTSIDYMSLTNPQVYQKSFKPQFPLTNIQPSFYVVRSIKNDIGEAHLTTQTFFYQDLLLHKQGKGLLGFGKRSVTDNFTGISAETISDLYVIQQKFYLPYAKEIKTKKASGEIISLTLNILKHKSYTSSPLRLFPYIESTHTIEKDITTNGFVKTTHADFTYDDFGNMLSTVVLIDPAEKEITAVASDYKHQTTTNYQYYSPDLTNWLVGKPEKITTQTRFLNEVKDGATQVLIYYPADHSSFPFIKEKQTFPSNILNGNLATSELFTYDDFGNIETITLSAPNSQPQLETRTSSKIFGAEYHHRFPTTTTNALLNTASATYDPVYGTLKTSTGPNELTSQFESNPLGTFSKTIAPDGSTTITVSRWANGNEHAPANALYYTWQQTSGSPEVMVFYHKTGAELRSVTFGFDGNPVYIDKIYNNKGLLHKESLPYKKGTTPLYTEYLYDNYNRLKDVIAPDDTKTTTTYAANEVNVTVVNGNITRTSKKKYNAAGWLEESTDNSGSVVKNEYYCNGNLKKSYIVGQPATAISLEYDARGNRTLLDDPNYGQMVTVYNAYGELITQTNPRNETTSFTYDKLGRMTNESSQTEGNIAWTYSTTPKRIGTLENIIKNNHRTNYVYDDKLRLTSETEIIDGTSYSTRYTYDELGRPFRTTYPTGVTLQDGYNNYGYHTTVSLESSGKQLWKTEQVNAMGLVTKYRTGNDLETEQTYYPLTSLPYTVQTVKKGNEPVQDLEYKWDGLGNLEYRKKWLNRGNNTSLTESFTYDGLDRLISGSLNGSFTTLYHTYDIPKLGNMTYKYSDGNTIFTNAVYGINGFGPHAITEVTTANPILTGPKQEIEYNGYEKVSAITEGVHSLLIQYGHHMQRISQQYTDGSNTIEKVWAGACEFVTKNGQQYKYTYLSGPLGLFAIHIIKPDGTAEINYIHTDHLGSWNTITDESGNLLQELSFDAWGNRRDPLTWKAFTNTAPDPLFDRGFTGHEHLYAFNLINMNGRFYDPILGRMLSPDNYIQAPDFSQSFNRYSYCWNNPLKYVDPSGNELGVVAGYQGYGYYLGFANSNGIPWYAQYRTRKQNYLHMSRSNFMKLTGASNEVYNGIAANWKTGFTYTNGSYYYYGMPVTYNQVHNNYIIPGSEFNAKGNNASSFVNALNNSYGGNLALWVYSNVFGGNVAVLGNENKEPGLYGNDLTGYRSANAAYGVFYGVAGVIVGKGMGENNALGRGDNSEFNIENAVNYLNRNAYPKYDKATCGYCARAVRKSLEAGGINTSNRPNSAKDYGPYLQKWGFGIVERNGYTPLKGDIRVFQNYEGGSKHGHINMFNGNQWVSDFYENGFWPGRGYRENNAAFTIYRWDD